MSHSTVVVNISDIFVLVMGFGEKISTQFYVELVQMYKNQKPNFIVSFNCFV